jgi:hypothetical protein
LEEDVSLVLDDVAAPVAALQLIALSPTGAGATEVILEYLCDTTVYSIV